jgi:hypothetical protein
MSECGTITEWDGASGWGTIRLDAGSELRFNRNACSEGVSHEIGAKVWVAAHVPYVGGKRRATAVHATSAAELTPFDRIKKRSELDQVLTERLIRELGRGFEAEPYERVPHIDRELAQFGIVIDTTVLDTDEHEPLGIVYQPEELVAWTPFDPCFVAFGGIDGDAWGALCYPALLARGEAPIVMWEHTVEPIAFEAATFSHWLAKRASSAKRKTWLAQRGFVAPARVSTTALAKDVRAIVDGRWPAIGEERTALAAYLTSETDERIARLDALIDVYRMLRWPAMIVRRAEVQRGVLVAREAYDGEVARIRGEHHRAHPDVYP